MFVCCLPSPPSLSSVRWCWWRSPSLGGVAFPLSFLRCVSFFRLLCSLLLGGLQGDGSAKPVAASTLQLLLRGVHVQRNGLDSISWLFKSSDRSSVWQIPIRVAGVGTKSTGILRPKRNCSHHNHNTASASGRRELVRS